jgi:hypothetical protein
VADNEEGVDRGMQGIQWKDTKTTQIIHLRRESWDNTKIETGQAKPQQQSHKSSKSKTRILQGGQTGIKEH